ncbi:hypothetical protein [uncultured Treponema sp.]|uniref:hypothetical protein n=1 Tax=uncultured Treponema sp. TaxID=162155 RepID=UPI00280B4CC7|nr:hypothetical protein [uncultured Treponema sp.]
MNIAAIKVLFEPEAIGLEKIFSNIRSYSNIEIYRFPEYKKFLKEELKEYYWDSCINSLHCFRNIKIYKKAKQDFLEYINSDKIR